MSPTAKPAQVEGASTSNQDEQHAEDATIRANWRSSDAFVTLAVAFAAFTDTMLYNIVFPFLPQLFSGRLGVPPSQIEQWTTVTMQAFGVMTLIFTWISGAVVDRYESKTFFFLSGLILMAIATLFFFLSTNPYLVILGRSLQGASTAIVWVSGVAFLVSHLDPSTIGFYMGYSSLGLMMGELAGPLVGGWLYDRAGHWAVFSVAQTLILVDILLRILIKNKKRPGVPKEEDMEHAAASETAPLLTTSSVIVECDQAVIGEENTIAAECMEQVAHSEIRVKIQTLGWNYLNSIFCFAVASIVRCGMEASVPLFVLRHFGWSSSASGATLTALLLPNILGPTMGKLAAQNGPRRYSIYPFAICSISTASLGFLVRDDIIAKILLVICIAVTGIGLAVGMLAHQNTVYITAPQADELQTRARASGLTLGRFEKLVTSGMMLSGLNSAWSSGLLLGPTMVSVIHFTTDFEWLRVCLFWSAICLVSSAYSVFTWKEW